MSGHSFGFAVRAMIFFLFSQAAPVAILLSALFSERYSLGDERRLRYRLFRLE
jgi:hypothetical protein